MNTPWTNEQFELAKKLWQEGKTAREISNEIGKPRGAVLSKLHRTGNHERVQPKYMKEYFKPDNAGHKFVSRAKPVAPSSPTAPTPEPQPNPIRCVTIRYLKRNSCRYPLSDDPRTTPPSKFLYCGARQTHGAYCKLHAQLAYIPLRGGRSAEREAMHMMVQQIKPAHEVRLLDKDALA